MSASKKAKRNNWKVIGQVGIDSAALFLGDPCNLGPNPGLPKFPEYRDKFTVTVDTPGGDGVWDVEGRYGKSGELLEIRVRFA
jgi:hypothetical protein